MDRLWAVTIKTPSPLHQRSVKVWHYLVLADSAEKAIELAKAELGDKLYEAASAKPALGHAVLQAVTVEERRRKLI